jgi:branched-chain amino acid transport system ATP-binding protein
MKVLQAEGIVANYGDFQALFGVDFALEEGRTAALIGANGAGKSTFLATVCGLLKPKAGHVYLDGKKITGERPFQIVKHGLSLVPEGRRLFPSLSVEENLMIGGSSRRKGPWSIEGIFNMFPSIAERRKTPATTLSGGQQQMVAIGRALMSNPKVLLCDEISLGLAPVVVKDIYEAFPGIRSKGTSIVVVEQDITQAMRVADHVTCFQEGRITLSGAPAELTRDQISTAYFGV